MQNDAKLSAKGREIAREYPESTQFSGRYWVSQFHTWYIDVYTDYIMSVLEQQSNILLCICAYVGTQ